MSIAIVFHRGSTPYSNTPDGGSSRVAVRVDAYKRATSTHRLCPRTGVRGQRLTLAVRRDRFAKRCRGSRTFRCLRIEFSQNRAPRAHTDQASRTAAAVYKKQSPRLVSYACLCESKSENGKNVQKWAAGRAGVAGRSRIHSSTTELASCVRG